MRTYTYLKRFALVAVVASVTSFALVGGVAQAACVPPYCPSGQASKNIQQQQKLAQQTQNLIKQISNPALKNALKNALKQSNKLSKFAQQLLNQAGHSADIASGSVSRRQILINSATVESLGGVAVARSTNADALANLKVHSRSIRNQVHQYLAQTRANAANANALIVRAVKPQNRKQALTLVRRAHTFAVNANTLSLKAKHTVDNAIKRHK